MMAVRDDALTESASRGDATVTSPAPARKAPRAPSLAAPELDPASPRHEGYRLPRVVVDICAARPVDLAIVDGIDSIGGAEGPWGGGEGCHPGLLVAGTNCVNTDAVATAVMGYDPMAGGGTAPFLDCDSFLELAERKGLGSRDLSRIEVAGTPVKTFAEQRGLSPRNAAVRVFRAREALTKRVVASCGTCAEHGCLDCTCGGAGGPGS